MYVKRVTLNLWSFHPTEEIKTSDLCQIWVGQLKPQTDTSNKHSPYFHRVFYVTFLWELMPPTVYLHEPAPKYCVTVVDGNMQSFAFFVDLKKVDIEL